MSQKGKGDKNVTQVKGNKNRLNINSFDINILGGTDRVFTNFLRSFLSFFQKGRVIGELKREIEKKDIEIERLKSKIQERIGKLFEAQQQIKSVSQLIEKAFQEGSSSNCLNHATYSNLKGVLSEFKSLQGQHQDQSIKACSIAGLWVSERAELWIKESMDEIVKKKPTDSIESQNLVYQDLCKYLDWIRDSLLIYAQPWQMKLDEINQNRSIKSPLLYREVFEYIQVRGDFGNLHDDEVYWLQGMIDELIKNL